ncbi:hypothetical protein [Cellulomonas sp. Marseille-Q8402]
MSQVAQTLRLAWQPEPDDYQQVARVLTRLRRRGRTGALLIGIALVSVGGGLLVRSAGTVVVGVVLGVLLVAPGTHRLMARRLWRGDPHARETCTADLTPGTGLRVTRGDVTSESPWTAWESVLETDALFLLRRRGGPPLLLVLAKRGAPPADGPADGQARLRELLTAELGEPVRV